MPEQNQLALDILKTLGIAVLLRTGPERYTHLGDMPPFYASLFPPTPGGPCVSPWDHSPMLEFFLEDAERFFEQKKDGALTSGIWQEDGRTDNDTALIAIATTYGETQVMIIRLLQEDFRERVGILRKARGQLLENRELSQNLEFFREKSRFDGLTKIFNKETFTELLQDEIKRSRALDYPLSLLILDIDDFKRVNDTHGHIIGDKVLQALGEIVTHTVRRNDVVARFGGEEFVILIPHEAQVQAAKIGEKLGISIANMQNPGLPSVTVSTGCTTYIPGESPDSFIERADTAFYDAKTSGKNRVCMR